MNKIWAIVSVIAIIGALFAAMILVPNTSYAAPPENNPGTPIEEIVVLLNQIQAGVDNVISLLTDPIFGLKELREEQEVIEQKVDGLNDKVDASENSGAQRIYVTLEKKQKNKIVNNIWTIKLKCPADDLSCGPMTVDILHFEHDFFTNDAIFNEICVDTISCSFIYDSIISVEFVQAPLNTNSAANDNIFIRSTHSPVEAYTVQVTTVGGFSGDVIFGAIIPDGADIESPSHNSIKKTFVCYGNGPCD